MYTLHLGLIKICFPPENSESRTMQVVSEKKSTSMLQIKVGKATD